LKEVIALKKKLQDEDNLKHSEFMKSCEDGTISA
jgi:hypothetical protein